MGSIASVLYNFWHMIELSKPQIPNIENEINDDQFGKINKIMYGEHNTQWHLILSVPH